MPYKQSTFDLDVETFSEREKIIIRRLGEYRTVEADIRRQQRIISGELTNCLPSISVGPPEEDERYVIQDLDAERWGVDIDHRSERIRTIAKVVKQHVNMDGAMYTNRIRVAQRLRNVASDDEEEDQMLQDAYAMLSERGNEEAVKLTPAERYANARQREVERAQGELARLETLHRILKFTLDDLRECNEEWYTILYHKYVMKKHWKEVCKLAARGGVPLTEDEYRLARKKALLHFDKWAIGLR